jgi:hypothetical protein
MTSSRRILTRREDGELLVSWDMSWDMSWRRSWDMGWDMSRAAHDVWSLPSMRPPWEVARRLHPMGISSPPTPSPGADSAAAGDAEVR